MFLFFLVLSILFFLFFLFQLVALLLLCLFFATVSILTQTVQTGDRRHLNNTVLYIPKYLFSVRFQTTNTTHCTSNCSHFAVMLLSFPFELLINSFHHHATGINIFTYLIFEPLSRLRPSLTVVVRLLVTKY